MELMFLLEHPKARCTGQYIRKNFPQEYEIISKLPGKKFSEKIYRYFHPEIKNECVVCGAPTSFININKGFNRTCCYKCNANDPEREKKRKETNLKRYGDENYNNRDKYEATIKATGIKIGFASQKYHDTIKSKYGVDNISQLDETKKKVKQTCLKNHGVDCVLRKKETHELARKACLEKYGVEYIAQLPGFTKRAQDSRRKKYIESNPHIIDIKPDETWVCKCPHEDCEKCTEKYYYTRRGIYTDRKRSNYEQCTRLNPIGHLSQNTTIEIVIKKILDEHGIKYQYMNRSIISPKELDIYCPDYKIAIECNGVYWHSDENKPTNYHINKYKSCESKGVRLISMWEDWVTNKPEIMESMLLSKFGIFSNRIGARQCEIKEIPPKEAQRFFEKNHIQGKCKSKIRYGLLYKDMLVAVMAFNHRSRLSGSKYKSGWELIRFCSLLNWQIVGGAERLLKYFTKQHNPNSIISFSSNDISDGSLYRKLGFEKLESSASYWYVHRQTHKRFHRSSFCKARLKQMGFDTTKTEYEIMKELAYLRIHDSGTTRWELNF